METADEKYPRLFMNSKVDRDTILKEDGTAVCLDQSYVIKTYDCIQEHGDMLVPLRLPTAKLQASLWRWPATILNSMCKEASPGGKKMQPDWRKRCRQWMAKMTSAVLYRHKTKELMCHAPRHQAVQCLTLQELWWVPGEACRFWTGLSSIRLVDVSGWNLRVYSAPELEPKKVSKQC